MVEQTRDPLSDPVISCQQLLGRPGSAPIAWLASRGPSVRIPIRPIFSIPHLSTASFSVGRVTGFPSTSESNTPFASREGVPGDNCAHARSSHVRRSPSDFSGRPSLDALEAKVNSANKSHRGPGRLFLPRSLERCPFAGQGSFFCCVQFV